MSDHAWALDEAEALWTGVLKQVGEDALRGPSGCADWTNRNLINHVIGGGERYAMLLQGASAEETATTRGSDYVAAGAVTTFEVYERLFRDAVEAADLAATVEHRAGKRPGRDLIPMRVMELTLHARDLATGVNVDWAPSEALAEYVLVEAGPILDEFRSWGAIGAQGSPGSAGAVDRLLAFAGRS